MFPNVTRSFKLQRPDLESCRAEAIFRFAYRWALFHTL